MSVRKITIPVATAALVGAATVLAAPAAAQADPVSCPEGVYATADGGLTVYGCVDGSRSVPLDGGGYWVAQPGTAVPVYSDTGQVGTATVTAATIEITSDAGADVPIWATIPAGVIVCGTAPTTEPEPEPTSEPADGPSTAPAVAGDATEPAPVSETPTPAPETGAPTTASPSGLPATGSGSTITAGLLVAGGVAVLGATAYALARASRRADDWLDDVAWTNDLDYQARRGLDTGEEDVA